VTVKAKYVPGSDFNLPADSAIAFAALSVLTESVVVDGSNNYNFRADVIQLSSGGIPTHLAQAGPVSTGLTRAITGTVPFQTVTRAAGFRRVAWMGGSSFLVAYSTYDVTAGIGTAGVMPVSWDGTTLSIGARIQHQTFTASYCYSTAVAPLGDGTGLQCAQFTTGSGDFTLLEHVSASGSLLATTSLHDVYLGDVVAVSGGAIAYDDVNAAFYFIDPSFGVHGPYDLTPLLGAAPEGSFALFSEGGVAILRVSSSNGILGLKLNNDGTSGPAGVSLMGPTGSLGGPRDPGFNYQGFQQVAIIGGVYGVHRLLE
jgi:hypothetical protein